MQHNSSIVIEVIRTILEFLLIYFFYKKILDIPKAQKSTKKHKKAKKAKKVEKAQKAPESTRKHKNATKQKPKNANKRTKIKNALKRHLSGKK